jgi:transcriptional regulator with XRE-family HTH domain
MTFADTLKKLRNKAGKSRYRLAQYSGINEAYILRLERGERTNPSRDVVLMLGLALVESSESVAIWDVDALLLAAGYAPLRRRGEVDLVNSASTQTAGQGPQAVLEVQPFH